MDSPGPDLLDRKKTQRCKRLARPDKDKAPAKYKRRKREEEEKTLHSSSTSSDPLMTQLRQVHLLSAPPHLLYHSSVWLLLIACIDN